MTKEELRDYVEEQRNLDAIPYHVYSTLIDGIDTLEQEPVLDKIRAEIEEIYMNITYQENKDRKATWGLRKALQIIDKYKQESEVQK